MKITTTLSALALGLALLPSTASATLLVGFHDFDANTTTESQDVANGGFSGQAIKSLASGDSGGSNDNFYGDSSHQVLPSVVNDGHAKVQNGSNMTFDFTNGSGSELALSSFLFDAAYKISSDSVLSLSYTITPSGGDGPIDSTVAHQEEDWTTTSDFSDFSVDLLGTVLGNGETISFVFSTAALTNGETFRLDNIALTAIPETASMMALALLIGGGLMTRNRRNAAAPTLA